MNTNSDKRTFHWYLTGDRTSFPSQFVVSVSSGWCKRVAVSTFDHSLIEGTDQKVFVTMILLNAIE